MKNVLVCFVVTLLVGICQITPAQEPLTRDELRIAVQKICPVSGNPFSEDDSPVKVQVGRVSMFICSSVDWQGEVNGAHLLTIYTNIAKAQIECPVMNKKLPNNPMWVVVEGQIVYICCSECGKKIADDPETYLKKVDQLYRISLNYMY